LAQDHIVLLLAKAWGYQVVPMPSFFTGRFCRCLRFLRCSTEAGFWKAAGFRYLVYADKTFCGVAVYSEQGRYFSYVDRASPSETDKHVPQSIFNFIGNFFGQLQGRLGFDFRKKPALMQYFRFVPVGQ